MLVVLLALACTGRAGETCPEGYTCEPVVECPEGYVCEPEDTGSTDDTPDDTESGDSDISDPDTGDTDAPVPDNTRPSDDLGGDFCDRDLLSRQPVPGASEYGHCVTQEVFCGQTIEGTTEGGGMFYDWAGGRYHQWCGTDPGDLLQGPERVFYWAGTDQNFRVVVERGCGELQAYVLLHENLGECPYAPSRGEQGDIFCSVDGRDPLGESDWVMSSTNGLGTNGWNTMIIVDSTSPEPVNFRLRIECGDPV
jgi:hypothetical protein